MSVSILRIPNGLDVSEYDRAIEEIDAGSKQNFENEAGIELIIQNTSDRETDSVNIPRNASSAQLSNGKFYFFFCFFAYSIKIRN